MLVPISAVSAILGCYNLLIWSIFSGQNRGPYKSGRTAPLRTVHWMRNNARNLHFIALSFARSIVAARSPFAFSSAVLFPSLLDDSHLSIFTFLPLDGRTEPLGDGWWGRRKCWGFRKEKEEEDKRFICAFVAPGHHRCFRTSEAREQHRATSR